MIKNIRLIFFVIIIIVFSKKILALDISAYLISNQAFKNYDFARVLVEYNKQDNNDLNINYIDELISSTITDNIVISEKIADTILELDPNNQDALLFIFVNFLVNSEYRKIYKIFLDKEFEKNDLVEYIFFDNDYILKNKNQISESFVEIIKSTYSSNMLKTQFDYNYLLYYTSLAIILDPNNYEAILIKAQLYELVENYIEAEIFYKKIPSSSAYYKDSQKSIAYNFSNYLNFVETEKNIINLMNTFDDNSAIKKILADYYRSKKKYNLAIKIYNELIFDEQKELSWLYYLRGICYERSDRWKDAESDFLKSLELEPDSPDVLNYLAYGWIEKNMNIEESFLMLERAYEQNPESYYILDSLAWAYYKKNKFEIAAKLMEKVIDMAPGEAISLDHLGDIYFAMNRIREAVHFWKQAKDLALPEDEITEKINLKLREVNEG